MMESGTLNFDDLMDTGDFPGFEIAKFTPATAEKENNRDEILRTPEPVQEDEDDDFVMKQSKNPEKVVNENGDSSNIQNEDKHKRNDADSPPKESTNDLSNLHEQETPITDLPGVDIDENEVKPDSGSKPTKATDENKMPQNREATPDKQNQPDEIDSDKVAAQNGGDDVEDLDYVVEINKEEGFVVEINKDLEDDDEDVVQEVKDEEPAHKKKRMSLLPPSKPKMKLWGGNNKKVDNKSPTPDTETMPQAENNADDKKAVVDSEDKKAEDDPHQQSFLSFLNLQPGNSKTANKGKKNSNQEQTKTDDFYSRKRLRTRKKVSYVEDVAEDIDDEYKDEEDREEPYDHQISVPRRRRSSSGLGRQNSMNNMGANAAMKYAEAMKKLNMPASAVAQFMPQKPLGSINNMSSSQRGRPQVDIQQHSTTQLYRNILPKGKQSIEPNSNGPMKGLFECGLCGTFFSTAGQFISHQEKAHNSKQQTGGRSGIETFRCEICQFVLTNRFAYLEHKRMKHSKNQITFNCNKCGSSFSYLIDLQKHKQICGLPYTYTCTHCNLQMRDLEEMTGHNAKFHPPQPALAAVKALGQQSVAVVNNARQMVACAIRHCSFKCLTQMEMKHHVQNKHNPQYRATKGELYPCNAHGCLKCFQTREQMMNHKREVHASEFIVQYQCSECKSCYSTKTLLAEHQYLHMMEKMKKCDICSRRFNSNIQLMKHKEVHVNKGTFKCTLCTRWCMDREELASHVCREKKQKLVGLRIYFCDICHHDFRTDELMFRHRKDHKNYYQCSTCQWDGKEEEDYFKHREAHGLFTCRECCEEIPTEAELSTHRKAHKFYVKMEEVEEEDGNPVPVMYLCPSLMNAVKAEAAAAAETGPEETVTAEKSPAETAPEETGHAEKSPAETAPEETGTREKSPAETNPEEAGLAETVPAETVPAETIGPETIIV